MAKQRTLQPLSMSFLDLMACGFGAVTLLFLIVKHTVEETVVDPTLKSEISLLSEEIRVGEEEKARLRNSLEERQARLVEAQGRADRVVEQIREKHRERSIQSDPEEEIARLRKQVETLERETAELRDASRGKDLRTFAGDGDRQYLTGLKLGGRRVVILLDSSASMLADDLVNVIRRRNMDDAAKRRADKWQRAVRTAEWLLARTPSQSRFQIYTFNTGAASTIAGSDGTWHQAADGAAVSAAVAGLKKTVPQGGTSLVNAFRAVNKLSPAPDNIFLITDSLPTQGATTPAGNTVSARDRVRYFNEAAKELPRAPVNVILFPMEGDPAAAGLFWNLGLSSGGSFLSPATDWP
ncbi:MAG: VWA domain-containing protein [Pseudomonas sp.]